MLPWAPWPPQPAPAPAPTPALGSPYVGVQGCVPAFVTGTVVTVGPGRASTVDGYSDMLMVAALPIDFAVNGVQGLDAGTVAANTKYALYVCRLVDGTITVIASTTFAADGTGVVVPPGTRLRYVGHVHTIDGVATIQPFACVGNLDRRTYRMLSLDLANFVLNNHAGSGNANVTTTLPNLFSPWVFEMIANATVRRAATIALQSLYYAGDAPDGDPYNGTGSVTGASLAIGAQALLLCLVQGVGLSAGVPGFKWSTYGAATVSGIDLWTNCWTEALP